MVNPFRPGNGIEPPYLAGRGKELQDFKRSLDIALTLPRNLVISGLRGAGKTVLLKQLATICQKKGWLSISREFNERFCDEEKFVEAISTDIMTKAQGVSLSKRLRDKGKQLAELVKRGQITYKDFSYQLPEITGKKPLLEDYLKTILTENWKIFDRTQVNGLVFLYDEFHTVVDGRIPEHFPLATLLGALSYAQREGMRYYLVVSGLPPLYRNILEAKTYAERMFTVRELANLSKEEAAQAISKPLEGSGYSFSGDLIRRIVDDTKGYPYFLQFYGHFLIEHIPEESISLQDLMEIRPLLLRELDVSFFEGRFERASDAEKRVLLAMAYVGDRARTSDIIRQTDVSGDVTKQLLGRLGEKGLIYRIRKGVYSFTLPLFREFLLRQD